MGSEGMSMMLRSFVSILFTDTSTRHSSLTPSTNLDFLITLFSLLASAAFTALTRHTASKASEVVSDPNHEWGAYLHVQQVNSVLV